MNTLNRGIPSIPDTAPFSEAQRAWLNGFLAGLFSEQGASETEPAGKELTLLFGSQTGNSEGLAKKTAKAITKLGGVPKLVDLGEYSVENIAKESCVLLITSTYGEGEPPDNAVAFYDYLHADDAPKLEGLEYSVLGLGDSGYPDFCQGSRDFDKRLSELGAKAFVPAVECDVDFDEPFESWLSAVGEYIAESGAELAATDGEVEEETAYDKKNPFPAKLLTNRELTGEGSGKEVRHFEISLEGSGLEYEVGDALGVMPENCPELVQAVIEKVHLDPAELVGQEPRPLAEVLQKVYDIRLVNAAVLEKLVPLCSTAEWKPLLGADKRDELNDYLWGRELIDVLEPVFEGAEQFLSILRKLQPRLYSISSSPNAHSLEVHLTVGAVRYEGHGRSRKGVCSTYLADRVGESSVGVFVHKNPGFRLPTDGDTPVIMVGPGTGIAPFRAFLEERVSSESKGKNWLFFGDRSAKTDFLYEAELKAFHESGALSYLDTAFSRDQAEKIYVQHRMLERASELWAWLEEGAHFYVCGDASRMAKDVDLALHQVLETQGAMSSEEAGAYIKEMKKAKRYQRDVY